MMHELYSQNDLDVCICGASSAYRHYNPAIWDEELNCSTFNIGSSAQRPETSYYLIKEVFDRYKPSYLIYSLSAFVFTEYPNWDNPSKDYIVFDYMPWSKNKVEYGYEAFGDKMVDGFIQFSRNRNKDLFSTLREVKDVKKREEYKTYDYKVYNDSEEELHPKGFVSSSRHLTDKEVGKLNTVQFADYPIREKDIVYMDKIAETCRENKCQLILVVPPIHYGSMGNYYDYQEVVDFYKMIAERVEAPLFDFSLAKRSFLDMKDRYYYDWGHMSGEGADYYSLVASRFLSAYISGFEINYSEYFYDSYGDVLKSSPYIYNVWMDREPDRIIAYCNAGEGVIPEFSFWGSSDGGENWMLIKAYSVENSIVLDDIKKDYDTLMVKTRVSGSNDDYQQSFRMEIE